MKNLLLPALIVLILSGCDNAPVLKADKEGSKNLYETPAEDVEMNNAIKKAKNTFGEFDKAFTSNKFDTSTFSIKVRFQAEDNRAEHIWTTGLTIENGDYFGIIDDLPELSIKVKQGEKIKINRNDISDWMYSDKGILRGGYSIKLIRKRMSKAEGVQFDNDFPLRIED